MTMCLVVLVNQMQANVAGELILSRKENKNSFCSAFLFFYVSKIEKMPEGAETHLTTEDERHVLKIVVLEDKARFLKILWSCCTSTGPPTCRFLL